MKSYDTLEMFPLELEHNSSSVGRSLVKNHDLPNYVDPSQPHQKKFKGGYVGSSIDGGGEIADALEEAAEEEKDAAQEAIDAEEDAGRITASEADNLRDNVAKQSQDEVQDLKKADKQTLLQRFQDNKSWRDLKEKYGISAKKAWKVFKYGAATGAAVYWVKNSDGTQDLRRSCEKYCKQDISTKPPIKTLDDSKKKYGTEAKDKYNSYWSLDKTGSDWPWDEQPFCTDKIQTNQGCDTYCTNQCKTLFQTTSEHVVDNAANEVIDDGELVVQKLLHALGLDNFAKYAKWILFGTVGLIVLIILFSLLKK